MFTREDLQKKTKSSWHLKKWGYGFCQNKNFTGNCDNRGCRTLHVKMFPLIFSTFQHIYKAFSWYLFSKQEGFEKYKNNVKFSTWGNSVISRITQHKKYVDFYVDSPLKCWFPCWFTLELLISLLIQPWNYIYCTS